MEILVVCCRVLKWFVGVGIVVFVMGCGGSGFDVMSVVDVIVFVLIVCCIVDLIEIVGFYLVDGINVLSGLIGNVFIVLGIVCSDI